MSEERFASWGIVELFGHNKIAGYLTDVNIAGGQMLRVDVPAVDDKPAFTKYYGNGAIYGLTPTDQETAEAFVKSFRVIPHDLWTISGVIEKRAKELLAPAKDFQLEPNSYFSGGEEDDIPA